MDPDYYRLARENEDLRRRIAELEHQIRQLRHTVADLYVERDAALAQASESVKFGR